MAKHKLKKRKGMSQANKSSGRKLLTHVYNHTNEFRTQLIDMQACLLQLKEVCHTAAVDDIARQMEITESLLADFVHEVAEVISKLPSQEQLPGNGMMMISPSPEMVQQLQAMGLIPQGGFNPSEN